MPQPSRLLGCGSAALCVALGGTQLLFGASDLSGGLQPWRSDGTAANTARVSNFGGAGYGAVSLAEFFATGARTYSACDDGSNGVEPWLYDPNGGGVGFVLPYGRGCRLASPPPAIGALDRPTLGNASFALTLAQALPSTAALALLAPGSSSILLGSCRLLLDLPLLPLPLVMTDATGFARLPLPVPGTPTLAGGNLFFQWAIVDPAGGFLGAIAMSNGLQVQIGR
jgi:ELWxxDGT repeat protein